MTKIKTLLMTLCLIVISGVLSVCIANGNVALAKKPLYWIDPMEPTVHYDKPGKSRMGMDVVPIYADDTTTQANASIITLSPAVVDNLGVRTAPVLQGDLSQQIETVGYVNIDENAMSHIHTYATGWIKKLFVKAVGDPVMKDQLLFQLYSPDLVNAQEEYLIALTMPQKELVAASYKKLLALGVSPQQIERVKAAKKSEPLIDINAPQDGFITELNVREGMQVTPELTIMSLADLKKVWMMVEVYESQAQRVSVGEKVEAKLSSMPGKVLVGQIDYIYPQVDPTTRTLKVRLCFDNPNNVLKPGMYANISLLAAPRKQVISIPQEALIRTGHGDRVIMALGQGQFEPRTVVAGMESGDRIEIISGLKPGESVVTSAQFLIDSEANLKGALDRLSAPDLSASTATSKSADQSDPTAIGIIKTIQLAEHQLTVSHQPISALNWPAMTMSFFVTNDVDLSQLKPGDKIQFDLNPKGDEFVITHIIVMKV
ncbi:MAG: hypothetical protein A2X77_04635 [Gammaproteobacteria bacterium GWE2_42_36]|nr:MAG: hypothetical protein A2X77_04635 [Gammaproteobacteria bacterium GWE2_42_36]